MSQPVITQAIPSSRADFTYGNTPQAIEEKMKKSRKILSVPNDVQI
jgi:hypothetical protein